MNSTATSKRITTAACALAAAALLSAAGLGGCRSEPQAGRQPSASVASDEQGVVYTCPMHPQVLSHEPGKCPICGMNLVEKKP